MQIVTISREFGSGGRELGKRLADCLDIPCYDHEIIEMVAEKHGLDPSHVARVSEREIRVFYPTTIAHRLIAPHPAAQQSLKIAVSEHQIIRELARQGNCVIIGRCADVVLREFAPMSIFVYASQQSKLERCRQREGTAEHLPERELLRAMRRIDRDRAAYRELFTENDWGRKESYHLCVNTSGKEIKALTPAVAEYVRLWFGQK